MIGRQVAIAAAALATAFLGGEARGEAPPAPARVVPLLTQALPDLPGGASLPHRHDAHVFVYVLEGRLTMQVAGGPSRTLGPGEVFYEAPGDVHQVSANASATEPAKFLVVALKDQGRALSRPAAPAP